MNLPSASAWFHPLQIFKYLFLPIPFFYIVGNDNLFALPRTNRIMNLYLQKWDGSERTANYSNFYINDENDNYRLTVSNFTIRKCIVCAWWLNGVFFKSTMKICTLDIKFKFSAFVFVHHLITYIHEILIDIWCLPLMLDPTQRFFKACPHYSNCLNVSEYPDHHTKVVFPLTLRGQLHDITLFYQWDLSHWFYFIPSTNLLPDSIKKIYFIFQLRGNIHL